MKGLRKIFDARMMPAVCSGVLIGMLLATGCSRPSTASPSEDRAQKPADIGRVGETPPSASEKSAATATNGETAPQSPPESAASAEPAPQAASDRTSTPDAAKPTSQRPKADRTPARPGEAEKITFEDLLLMGGAGMQADIVFREFMLTDRVKELDGKRVSLAGYMYGGVASTRGIKEFILLRAKECKFGPGGQADHLAEVILRNGATTDFTLASVKVEGNLKVEDFKGPDGNTWSIYRLEDAQVR